MTNISRRHLLAATAAATLASVVPALAQEAPAKPVDIAALNTPPEYGDMSIGPDTAKVTVIEYASATCSHCAAFHKDVWPSLKKEYIDTGKIKFVFREFPLDDLALAAFMVARCAPKEKYFPMMDVYFATQQSWTKDPLPALTSIAQQAGMTKEQFDACLKNETLAKQVLDTRKAGDGFGVNGTPTFFINGQKLGGETSMEKFRAIIDPLLG